MTVQPASINATPGLNKQEAEPAIKQTPLQLTTHLTNIDQYDAIVDSRPLAICQQSSLAGAMCLPVEDILAPNGRLANWSGILWLLGSANLAGSEHVLVIGQQTKRRQFIAGLLLLAGQRRITVLEDPVSRLMEEGNKFQSGANRATTRTRVFTAPMRSELIVLQSELGNLITTGAVLLDGRSEAEYYGAKIYAARGGHIPGAIHSPHRDWQHGSAAATGSTALYRSISPVTYAHDTFDSVIYLTKLHAAGVNARVYLAGWVEWAVNGALPVDSVSYPPRSATTGDTGKPSQSGLPATSGSTASVNSAPVNVAPADATMDEPSPGSNRTGLASAAAMVVLCLLVASFYTGRKFSGRTA